MEKNRFLIKKNIYVSEIWAFPFIRAHDNLLISIYSISKEILINIFRTHLITQQEDAENILLIYANGSPLNFEFFSILIQEYLLKKKLQSKLDFERNMNCSQSC